MSNLTYLLRQAERARKTLERLRAAEAPQEALEAAEEREAETDLLLRLAVRLEFPLTSQTYAWPDMRKKLAEQLALAVRTLTAAKSSTV